MNFGFLKYIMKVGVKKIKAFYFRISINGIIFQIIFMYTTYMCKQLMRSILEISNWNLFVTKILRSSKNFLWFLLIENLFILKSKYIYQLNDYFLLLSQV